MEKSEFRVLIKHYFLRGKSIKETEGKLARYYKESAPSHGMVHELLTEFRCSRISTSDAERLGSDPRTWELAAPTIDASSSLCLSHSTNL